MATVFQALGISAALALAGCGVPESLVELDCTPLSVTVGGEQIVGIEDMAIIDESTLILSAYNRRDISASPKGLFALDVPQLGEDWKAERLTPADAPLVPHGLAFDGSTHLYVIDRGANAPQILRYTWTDDKALSHASLVLMASAQKPQPPYPCNLNDLSVTRNGDLLFTNDRRSCSRLGRFADNVFGRQNGSLWKRQTNGDIAQLAGDMFFPNGLADKSSGETIVALTRRKQVMVLSSGKTYDIGGAPDNLLPASDGSIWGTAIPSLPRYALYRHGLFTSAEPSLVFKLGDSLERYSAPTYSGATVAAQLGTSLYLGGAYTPGIAQCELPDAV